MRAVHLVLLAVYASIATSTLITYTLVGNNFPVDARQRIDGAMKEAADFYNTHTRDIPPQHIKIYWYPKIRTSSPSRADSAIWWGWDPNTQQKYSALYAISQVLGVGQTPPWTARCQAGLLKWGMAENMFARWVPAGVKLGCNKHTFWPYGMYGREDFNDDNAIKHVKLVEAFVKRGLQDNH